MNAYTPSEGIKFLRALARSRMCGAVVHSTLASLRRAQSSDDSPAAEDAYAALDEVAPAHHDGRLRYSRVDATIVSRSLAPDTSSRDAS